MINANVLSDSGGDLPTTYYNRNSAVSYALNHGSDTPTYSAANGNGSDCANFLSYCLNAGDIPRNNVSWKPGHVNWFRTGAYDNGGVTPYMSDKNYFIRKADISNAMKGSFLFWTSNVILAVY